MPFDTVVHLPLSVDALTGKKLNEYGDEVRDPHGFPEIYYRTTVVFAVEFLDRELAPDLSWNLAAHPLDAEKTYVLSGGCDRGADASPMFLCDAEKVNLPGDWPDGSDPDPALGRLTFRVIIDEAHFSDIAGHDELSKCCSMTVTVNSGSDSAVMARIPFRPRKRADESAGGSSGGSSSATTVNGLSGTVILADQDGTPFPADGRTITIETGGDVTAAGDNEFTGANSFTQMIGVGGYPFSGLIPHNDPLDAYAAKSATLGWYTWMDTGATPLLTAMTFDELQRNLKAVTFKAYSIDETSSGNVVLIPVVNGVDQDPVTIAVTPTATLVTIPLDVAEGMVTVRRDYGNVLDTLDASVKIYGITAWCAK